MINLIFYVHNNNNNFVWFTIFFSDQSIPTLESILSNNETALEETNKISQLITRQITMETNLATAQSSQTPKECTPPPVCHDFQTSRLFLSHFGLLALDNDDKQVKLIVLFSNEKTI